MNSKILLCMVGFLVAAGVSLADPLRDIQVGEENNNAISHLYFSDTIEFGAHSLSITNGEIVPNSYSLVYLTATDQAISTNTIAAPGTWGQNKLMILVNAGTNSIYFADNGTMMSSGATTLGSHDTWMLLGATATNWVELGQGDN